MSMLSISLEDGPKERPKRPRLPFRGLFEQLEEWPSSALIGGSNRISNRWLQGRSNIFP